jgi:hypothetical protein
MLLLAICYVEKDWGRNIVCWDLLEKLRLTQLLKKFPAFCGSQMLIFFTVVWKSIPWSLQRFIGIPSVLLHLNYGIFILVVSPHICICPPSHPVPFYEHFVSIYYICFRQSDLIVRITFLKSTNYEDLSYACFPILLLVSVCQVRAFSSTADTCILSWGHVMSDLMGLIFGLLSLEWQWPLSCNIVLEQNKIILYHIGNTVTK